MKICITSQGKDLDSAVDPRFGRAQYFLAVDVDSLNFEVIENQNANGTGGVGIQTGRLMAEKGIECILTGNIGPNASQTLQAAGIPFCLGATGTIREAVEQYKQGKLSPSSGPNVDSKSGLTSIMFTQGAQKLATTIFAPDAVPCILPFEAVPLPIIEPAQCVP